jgi:hypothetical protein
MLAGERRELFPNFFVKRRERETGSRGLGWGPSAGIFSQWARPSSNASNTYAAADVERKSEENNKKEN